MNYFKPQNLIILFSLLSCACSTSESSCKSSYRKQANRLMVAIDQDNSSASLEQESLKLMRMGGLLMREIGKKKAMCHSYFDFVDGHAQEMTTLSLDEIEIGYHEGQKLPPTDDECFAVKELVVHPATVFILSKSSLRSHEIKERMKAEIDEVLEHLNLL